MKNKNLFQRLRGAFEGIVQSVRETFSRTEPSSTGDPDVPPVEVPDILMPASETTYIDFTDEGDTSEPEEYHDPLDNLTPEEILELENDDFPTQDPSNFDSSTLRRIFASGAEAESYASEIPVPTTVFKRSGDGLYQVAVEYP